MKRAKALVIGMVIVCSMASYAPAKAATTAQSPQQQSSLLGGLGDWLSGLFGGGSTTGSGSTGTGTATGGSGSGTSLPINGNVWLLVIAGTAVGYRAIVKKSKMAASQNG